MGRGRAANRWNRYRKGMSRVKNDRNEHSGEGIGDPLVVQCECFSDDVSQGRGVIFAYFADTPQRCSCWMCGNARRYYGLHRNELRAPRATEWD